jgi:hypothetical protein
VGFENQSPTLNSKKVTRTVTFKLPPAHSREQYELINAFELYGCRFVVGACGTKFGKTYGCSLRLAKEAWNNKGSLNWWVAPSYAQSKMAYRTVKRLLPKGTFTEYKADLKLILLEPDGSEHSIIEFKSGDNPDTLRGFAVNFVVIDEAARVPEESFISILTTLTHTRGRAIIISTPKGRGWFYQIYERGNKNFRDGSAKYRAGTKDPWPEWKSVRLPTYANPTVSKDSLVELKRNLSADQYRQEVEAEFLLESAGVFRGIRDCITAGPQRELPLPGRAYIMGIDLARVNDFTVLTVIDQQRMHVVYHERFNSISWNVQYYRIIEIARAYNRAHCLIDATGIGDPIVETLQQAGVHADPYKIGGSTQKQQLIEKLRVTLEQGKVSFPSIGPLLDELEAYEYEYTPNGTVRYSAPSGQHDDCVISLALAVWLAEQPVLQYRYRNVRGV